MAEKVKLFILQENLDLIKQGVKKREWRKFSDYYKKLLFKRDLAQENKWNGNPEIKEIEFVVRKTKETLTMGVKSIRLIKFSKDVRIEEEKFTALSGQFAIEILFL